MYDLAGDYSSRDSLNMSRRMISRKELDYYLCERTEVSPVKLEQGSKEEDELQQQIIAKKIPNYEGTREESTCIIVDYIHCFCFTPRLELVS